MHTDVWSPPSVLIDPSSSLMILYILNYLDRQNIASAKLDTLVKDLKLTPVQYSTCISCLFAGYIAFQVRVEPPRCSASLTDHSSDRFPAT